MNINCFSIVIPIYNEEDNINILYNEIKKELSKIIDYEIIFVNDGSTDGSKNILRNLENYKDIKIIQHQFNLGQSRSLLSGISSSKYETIVTLDGDGQNDPRDILKLTKIFFSDKDLELVGGLRLKRKDSPVKVISSQIANYTRSRLLKDNCLDTGCGLKVFNKKIFLFFPFFDGIHRFLPALFNGYGYKTKFVEVNHRKRMRGVSKYGTLKRLLFDIKDIIRVKKIINRKNNV